MCGICCIVPLNCDKIAKYNELNETLCEILKNRGPDIQHKLKLSNGITFYGFVLWQQGSQPAQQPFESDKYILLFNGDIFNVSKDEALSDTAWLSAKLDQCDNEDEMLELLKNLEGPYSLVVYNKQSRCLYFTRDPLGRNSLLLEKDENIVKILSSSCMSFGSKTIEVPSVGVFKLKIEMPIECTLYPWIELTQGADGAYSNVSDLLDLQCSIAQHIKTQKSTDCRLEPLYNFPDLLRPSLNVNNVFENFLSNAEILQTVLHLKTLIRNSVKDRVSNTPRYCSDCVKMHLIEDLHSAHCFHTKLGILFSGGIDCTILAALAHECLMPSDPIDLINVAFEPVSKNFSGYNNYQVPDRLSAIESFNELKTLFPERQWNLVQVDVPRNELQTALQDHIRHLIYPLETVLDESLGCAFWFAARGQGKCNGEAYCSSSRVILVGSGADELFGGYTRHRNAFNRCPGNVMEKIKALGEELKLDWRRISTRNLGRDDRVTADNGRTLRAPFIEESLVRFVTQLHPLEICCFDLDPGVGDKLLLRLVGYSLGLKSVSQFKKRAIQFGSRIANKNQNAKDISPYLSNQSEHKIE